MRRGHDHTTLGGDRPRLPAGGGWASRACRAGDVDGRAQKGTARMAAVSVFGLRSRGLVDSRRTRTGSRRGLGGGLVPDGAGQRVRARRARRSDTCVGGCRRNGREQWGRRNDGSYFDLATGGRTTTGAGATGELPTGAGRIRRRTAMGREREPLRLERGSTGGRLARLRPDGRGSNAATPLDAWVDGFGESRRGAEARGAA